MDKFSWKAFLGGELLSMVGHHWRRPKAWITCAGRSSVDQKAVNPWAFRLCLLDERQIERIFREILPRRSASIKAGIAQ